MASLKTIKNSNNDGKDRDKRYQLAINAVSIGYNIENECRMCSTFTHPHLIYRIYIIYFFSQLTMSSVSFSFASNFYASSNYQQFKSMNSETRGLEYICLNEVKSLYIERIMLYYSRTESRFDLFVKQYYTIQVDLFSHYPLYYKT